MSTPVLNRTYAELPLTNRELSRTESVQLPGGVDLKMGTILGFPGNPARNEVQTLTIAGTGSFRLGLDGDFTLPILVAGLSATILQTAIDRLIGKGNCRVTGAGPYVFTFQGEYGFVDVPAMLLDNAGITGGPPTLAETTKGSAGASKSVVVADGVTVTARFLLMQDTKTAANGSTLTEFGTSGQFGCAALKQGGDVLCSRIPGLTSTMVGQLGKLARGNAHTDAGAELRLL